MNSKVSLVRCKSYEHHLVFEATKKAIDLIGGITVFVKPSSKVLVKPNLLLAKEPESGITTHPEVVRAVIKILKEINCKIYLGDCPNVWGNQIENVDEVYVRTGIKRVSQEEGVELVKFDKRRMRENFPLTTWLDECDHLVSIPKFKTHSLMTLTGAIKNLFGLVPGTFKTELHKKYFDKSDFAKMLVDVYVEARPSLSVIDGIVAIEGDGPATAGTIRNCGLLLAGADAVAIDSILALIMGLAPEDILTVQEAAVRRLGIADINSISVCGEKLEEVIDEPFKLPTTSLKERIPRPILEVAKRFIRFLPKIEHRNCVLCGTCIKVCPTKAMSIKAKRVVIDYKKCISCFCCQESCSYSAIKIKKSMLAKMMGL